MTRVLRIFPERRTGKKDAGLLACTDSFIMGLKEGQEMTEGRKRKEGVAG